MAKLCKITFLVKSNTCKNVTQISTSAESSDVTKWNPSAENASNSILNLSRASWKSQPETWSTASCRAVMNQKGFLSGGPFIRVPGGENGYTHTHQLH